MLEKKDECEEEMRAAKETVDTIFLKVKDYPKYKCVIYDTTELDDLICQFKNNIVKTKT